MMREREAYLRYRWTLAYVMPAGQQKAYDRCVSNSWKPILAYTKGEHSGTATDLVDKGLWRRGDKDGHEWGQSVEGFRLLIREWLKRPGLVYDPFCGAGNVLVAAALEGHEVAGSDNDAKAVALTRDALAKVVV